ncbi:30S ribosomal protein S16 [Candidatus Saccharibacteria bacterium]|nr:30S ribosomal protein S16 [Candidatus Saccharibacteria bacterium]
MLAIRLQRLGRKGLPVYRVAVQEAQRHPSSGRVVAYVGTYNPHTKEVTLQKEAVEKYLSNGAQPTPRVVKLLKAEGVNLPKWVKDLDTSKQKAIKNLEKLRKNQPAEEVAEEVVEEVAEEAPAEEKAE